MTDIEASGKVVYGSRTDVGRIRPHNEDSLVASPPLFCVADGMGGHEAGEVASEIAVQTLTAHAPGHADAPQLGEAVLAANQAVIAAAANGIGKPGMGTTMTAIVLEGRHLVVAQVGDSRAYLLHSGTLSQITRDHSLVADMVEKGQITAEEARWHPQRSVITRALGSDPDMVPDLFDLELEVGDRILLCSDGLSGMVYDDELARIMTEEEDPQKCADALIDTANSYGGHDNITAIIVDVAGTEEEAVVERKRSNRARRAVIASIVAMLLLCLVAGGALYAYAQQRAYLIDEDGYVTIYRGMPGSLAGISLSWYDRTTDVRTSDLDTVTEQRLEEGITVDSLDEAEDIVASYRTRIEEDPASGDASSSDGSSSSSSSTTPSSSAGKTYTTSSTSTTTDSTAQ